MTLGVIVGLFGLGTMLVLLFTLAIYAVPFFVGLTVGMWAFETGAGVIGAGLVGLVAGFAYSSRQTPFRPGDRLFAFTDGLIEASNSVGTLFGEERLSFVLGQSSASPFGELCRTVLGAVREFTGGTGALDDDVCIVALESTGNKPS